MREYKPKEHHTLCKIGRQVDGCMLFHLCSLVVCIVGRKAKGDVSTAKKVGCEKMPEASMNTRMFPYLFLFLLLL